MTETKTTRGISWTRLTVLDAHLGFCEVTGTERLWALRELRDWDSMDGYVLAEPGQPEDDCSLWGPDGSDIDWSGFPCSKTMTTTTTTIEPVTTSGLYEHTDGSVGSYTWRAGDLCLDWTEPGWEAAGARRDRERELGPSEAGGAQ